MFQVFYAYPPRKEAAQLFVSPHQDFRDSCHCKILGQGFAKRAHFRPSESLGRFLYKTLFPSKVKLNFVVLGKIKIFVRDVFP